MPISFKNLKSTKLGPNDKLTFGKFNGCRICDVWDDHFEYLIWADKSGYAKYTAEVISHLHERGEFAKIEEYFDNEVRPWIDDLDQLDELPF